MQCSLCVWSDQTWQKFPVLGLRTARKHGYRGPARELGVQSSSSQKWFADQNKEIVTFLPFSLNRSTTQWLASVLPSTPCSRMDLRSIRHRERNPVWRWWTALLGWFMGAAFSARSTMVSWRKPKVTANATSCTFLVVGSRWWKSLPTVRGGGWSWREEARVEECCWSRC